MRNLFFFLALLLAGISCSSQDNAASPLLATTPAWAEVVSSVACQADVPSLISAQADHHADAPSLADRSSLDQAEIIFSNGLGLEAGWSAALAATPTPVFEAATALNLTQGDPHFWLDPNLVRTLLPSIEAALLAHSDLTADELWRCRQETDQQLVALDVELAQRISVIPVSQRLLVTDHQFLTHLADRYDITVIDTLVDDDSSLAEASTARLTQLMSVMESTNTFVIAVAEDAHLEEAHRLAEVTGAHLVEVPVAPLPHQSLADILTELIDLLVAAWQND